MRNSTQLEIQYSACQKENEELKEALEDLLVMNEANPKCYEDSADWQKAIDKANSVLNEYKK